MKMLMVFDESFPAKAHYEQYFASIFFLAYILELNIVENYGIIGYHNSMNNNCDERWKICR